MASTGDHVATIVHTATTRLHGYSMHDMQGIRGHFTTWLSPKIDLLRAYHQIPVATEDAAKKAVTTYFGLLEF